MLKQTKQIFLIVFISLMGTHTYADNPKDWWVNIANNRVEQVKKMLDNGADPNEISPNGQPAIMYAIREDAWDVYELLVNDNRTALNAININRETPLMYLTVIGETKRAKDLIKKGAMVNREGWTPLHYAASTGKTDTALMLLQHGANVNARAHDGTTPLMMAAYAGSIDTAKLLLENGADPNLKTSQGYDVNDWAAFKSNTKLAVEIKRFINKDTTSQPVAKESNTLIDQNDEGSPSRYFNIDREYEPVTP